MNGAGGNGYSLIVDMTGMRQLQAAMPEKMSRLKYLILSSLTYTFENLAAKNAPVDTGRLMTSIRMSQPPKYGRDWAAVVAGGTEIRGVMVDYAVYAERKALPKWPRGPWYMKRSVRETGQEIARIGEEALRQVFS